MAQLLEKNLEQQVGGQDHGHAALGTGTLLAQLMQLPKSPGTLGNVGPSARALDFGHRRMKRQF